MSRRQRKMTEAAAVNLELLLDDRRAQIVERASTGTDGIIDAIDIIRAEQQLASGRPVRDVEVHDEYSRLAKRRADGRLLALIAALAAASMVICAVILLTSGSLSSELAALVTALLGVGVAVTASVGAITILQDRRGRETAHLLRELEFRSMEAAHAADLANAEVFPRLTQPDSAQPAVVALLQWGQVEAQLRRLAQTAGIAHQDRGVPIRVIVDSLMHDGLLSGDAEFRIKRMLKVRNEIAHRGAVHVDGIEMERDAELVRHEIEMSLRKVGDK